MGGAEDVKRCNKCKVENVSVNVRWKSFFSRPWAYMFLARFHRNIFFYQ